MRKSKDLGGGARQYYIARRIWLKRLKDVFLEGGVLFRLPTSRLGPPEHNRVELITFA
jgi:hypothetical protein